MQETSYEANQRSRDNIFNQLATHERDIALIRRDIGQMQTSVEHLASAVTGQATTLSDIKNLLHTRGAATVRDLSQWLQVMVMGAALIGGVVSGIVYISSNANDAELQLIKYRLTQIEAVTSDPIQRRLSFADRRDAGHGTGKQ